MCVCANLSKHSIVVYTKLQVASVVCIRKTLLIVWFQAHCYYRGVVEGIEDSLLALSTCDGLRYYLFILTSF